MDIRALIVSLACISCLLPVRSEPSGGLAQAAYDIAAAKGAALVATKAAIVKGAASLAMQGAAIGSSVVLGAIAGGLNATAEAIKPANEGAHSQDHSSGVIDKFSKVIELKQQLVHNLLDSNPTEKPTVQETTPLYFEPIVVQDVVPIPIEPQPVVVSQDLHVTDAQCDDELQIAPVPVRVLPPHVYEYHLPPPLPLRRMLSRGRYPLPLFRNVRLL